MTLRIGVIGVGGIGRYHIERINNKIDGAKVVAISDINVDSGKEYAKQIDATFYETGEELIAANEVDAVVVTSWGPTHKQYALESIKHEKYVFVEKPLAVTSDECLEIINAEIEKNKKYVQVGFMRRYDRGYEIIKEAVENKTYGEALLLHCAHRNPEVDESYTTPMAIEDTAVHEFDVLRWLLNEDFESVQVILPKKQTANTHKLLKDPQIVILETKSGVHIDLELFVNCKFGYEIKCDVVFEEGEVSLTSPTYVQTKANLKTSTGITPGWKERFGDAYDKEFQVWIHSVIADNITGPNAWDGYMASVTIDAAHQARESGEKVKFTYAEKSALYN